MAPVIGAFLYNGEWLVRYKVIYRKSIKLFTNCKILYIINIDSKVTTKVWLPIEIFQNHISNSGSEMWFNLYKNIINIKAKMINNNKILIIIEIINDLNNNLFILSPPYLM